MIRVEVLGPFRALDEEGREVAIPRGKLTGLLAHLASEPHGVERDALEALFWPDAAPRARRQSLRQALYSLRRAMDDLDPFLVGDRVRLDASLVETDLAEVREALAEGDVEAALHRFRGIPYTDVPSDASVALERWMEARRDEELQRLATMVENAAREALADADEGRARRLLHRGVQAGLDETALERAIYGPLRAGSPWAAARVGPEAVETLVYRARPGMRPLAALVLEEDRGWARRFIMERADALPEESRPAVVDLPAGGQAVAEVAGLIRALTRLPGGAAVGQGTTRTLRRLDALGPGDDLEPHRREAEAALTGALDAALHEQAVILVCASERLRMLPSSVLANAVARQGGEGLTLVVTGPDQPSLATLPCRNLLQAVPDVRPIRQVAAAEGREGVAGAGAPAVAGAETAGGMGPAGDAEVAGQAGVAGPADPRVGPGFVGGLETTLGGWRAGIRPAPRSRRWARRLGAALVVITAGVAAAVVLDGGGPVTAHDVVFCSPRAGAPHYYRWAPESGMVERFALDTAAHHSGGGCRGDGGLWTGDSIYLATMDRDTVVWRVYPDERSRGDLRGRRTGVLSTVAPGEPFRMDDGRDVVLEHWGPLWRLKDLRSGASRTLPVGGDDYFLSGFDPWVVFRRRGADGVWDLYRLHLGDDAVEQLTNHPVDESWGILRGDSLLFARGAMGDDEDGSLELFLLDLATGREVRLTDNGWNDYEVDWSPDGRHICWQSEELGHYQSEIMVMDLERRRVWNLSAREGRDHRCAFTPDGAGVLYRSLRGSDIDLTLRPVTGGEARNVTLFQGDDLFTLFVAAPAER